MFASDENLKYVESKKSELAAASADDDDELAKFKRPDDSRSLSFDSPSGGMTFSQ